VRKGPSTFVPLLGAMLLGGVLAAPASAASGPGQFVVRCPYSHTAMDDPIVAPGQPGASHEHDFFGNVTTDAFSTVDSMLAGDTTCRAASDTAGYWTPSAYLGGERIRPTVMRIYYLGDPGDPVETIPPGLQLIGGNKTATTASENPHVRWYCGETKEIKTPRQSHPYDCTPYSENRFVDGVVAIIDLPSCWDGQGLTPEHVIYPVNGTCPAAFGHRLPRLSERLHLGVMNPLDAGGNVAMTLASGPYWTMHADFWNTWQQPRLDDLVDRCLDAHVHCGSIDASVATDWTQQFGTSRYDLAYAASRSGDGVVVAGFTNLRLPGQRFHHRSDVFVRSIRSNGAEAWTAQFGGRGVDQGLAVAAADDGIYVAGFTDDRFPGRTSAGRSDAFVARLGPAGRLLWVRQFGSRENDRATAVVVGTSGVLVAGDTEGRLGARRSGRTDGFLARFGFDGGLHWVRQFGGRGDDTVAGLTLERGTVFLAGTTTGRFGGRSAGGTDGFVRAVTPLGVPRWTRAYGTDGDDVLSSIAVTSDSIWIAGSTTSAWPGETAGGGLDAFVSRLGLDGTGVWTRQLGSAAADDAASLSVDRTGVYVVGSTEGALLDQTHLGESDAFASRFLKNGAPVWTIQLGTTDYDRAYGGAVTESALYVAGTTHGTFEGQTNAGDRDVFVSRLRFT
jgi:uncharacterized protein DUF1996